MNEIFVVVGVLLVGVLALAEVSRRTASKHQDIARKLLSVEKSLSRSRNYAHMCQITPHGDPDRQAYFDMIDDETADALKTVRELKKDVL